MLVLLGRGTADRLENNQRPGGYNEKASSYKVFRVNQLQPT